MVSISSQVCVKCKGRLWCGPKCYIAEKQYNFLKTTSQLRGTSFSGSSPPGVFVSWHNYPKISIAPLSPPQVISNASFLDETEKWFGLSEERIISMRQQLIRSSLKIKADTASNPTYKITELQELLMATKPVEVTINLKNKPTQSIDFSDNVAPLGPKADLLTLSLNSNPRVDRKIDYITSDFDAKSFDALKELYKSNYSVGIISKLLSAGLLGVKKSRKFVPTRWSITATDSNISSEIIENKIKYFTQTNEFQIFSSTYLDNHFFILLLPQVWSFEQLEAWLPGSSWAQQAEEPVIISDHEFFSPRKKYASSVAGAYYASRLAIAEHLLKEKKQASAIVFREIGKDYRLSLGVWVIREAVRNALKKKPINFSSLELALEFVSTKLKVPLKYYKKESKLLDSCLHQKKLTDY